MTVIEEKLKRPSYKFQRGPLLVETKTSIVIICAQMRFGQMLGGGGPVNGDYECELHICTKKTTPFYLLLLQLNRLLRLRPLLPCKTFSGLSHSPLHLSRL